MRPKTEGPKEMASLFVSRACHAGMPMTKEQLDEVNRRRRGKTYGVTSGGVDLGPVWKAVLEKRGEKHVSNDKPPLQGVPSGVFGKDGNPDWVYVPGLRWLSVGKNREGYWDNDDMMIQVEDFMDCFEVVFPDHELLLEVDWSSGHGRTKPDGLSVNNMNKAYGGQQTIIRNSKIEDASFLGPWYDDDSVSARKLSDGRVVDYRVKIGEEQAGSFDDRAKPPFYADDKPVGSGVHAPQPVAPAHCKNYDAVAKLLTENDEAEAALSKFAGDFGKLKKEHLVAYAHARTAPASGKAIGKKPAGKKAELVRICVDLHGSDVDVQVKLDEKPAGYDDWKRRGAEASDKNDGWLGQPKGMYQYLFERGWICPGKSYSLDGQTVNGVVQHYEAVVDGVKVSASSSLKELMESLPDFRNETTLLEQQVLDRGHRLRKSPKCHPELAGEGVEYCWGKSKRDFRHLNDGIVTHLRENALRSLAPDVLPLWRIRRFERKAWSYKQAYRKIAEGRSGELTEAQYSEIEKLAKQQKAHRSCEKMQLAFIKAN